MPCGRSNGVRAVCKGIACVLTSKGGRRARRRRPTSHPIRRRKFGGVLYQITRAGLVRLDSTEGVPGRRYRHLWVDAVDIDGRAIAAVTYIAEGKETDGNPSLRYITLLRDGARAHGLPDHWLKYLDKVHPAE